MGAAQYECVDSLFDEGGDVPLHQFKRLRRLVFATFDLFDEAWTRLQHNLHALADMVGEPRKSLTSQRPACGKHADDPGLRECDGRLDRRFHGDDWNGKFGAQEFNG